MNEHETLLREFIAALEWIGENAGINDFDDFIYSDDINPYWACEKKRELLSKLQSLPL